jgi:predicted negative regulator of RcsB-dependent stress response
MATHLDLEEQEQLDQLKAFWRKYGNLIIWTAILALGVFGGWNLWQNHQRDQSAKASVLYDELDRSVQAGDLDKAARAFADLKERFPRTAYVQQAGLLSAKLQFEKGQVDPAIATLTWVADNAAEAEYKTLARLRLAGVLLDQKKLDEALRQLDRADVKAFAPLVSDRRGDVLAAQGKKEEARAAYQQAWNGMDATSQYRHMVDSKLLALGGAPDAEAPSAPKASGAGSAP